MKEYTYKVVEENLLTGERGKRTRTIVKYHPLIVGGLYAHISPGLRRPYRVLELVSAEEIVDAE